MACPEFASQNAYRRIFNSHTHEFPSTQSSALNLSSSARGDVLKFNEQLNAVK